MAITFKCPFYVSHAAKNKVKCEGGYSVNFETKKRFEEYTRRYCRSFGYKECGVARIWQDYYK